MEQWASGYGIQENQLIQTMPYILEGAAIDWWNTTPTKIITWKQLTTELLEYFLPPRYEEQLRTQITQLKQRDSEPVREYAMGLRKLMRFTKLSEEEKLDRIFNNCRSKIKLYTRRSGFRSMTEFLKLAEEVEEIEAADRTRHNQPAQQQIRPEIYSNGEKQPAIYGIHSTGAGAVRVESDAIRIDDCSSNIPAGTGHNNRPGNGTICVCLPR
nr:activity-regulated cytoskeleton associated protein 1-like [Drosophila kikkawai]